MGAVGAPDSLCIAPFGQTSRPSKAVSIGEPVIVQAFRPQMICTAMSTLEIAQSESQHETRWVGPRAIQLGPRLSQLFQADVANGRLTFAAEPLKNCAVDLSAVLGQFSGPVIDHTDWTFRKLLRTLGQLMGRETSWSTQRFPRLLQENRSLTATSWAAYHDDRIFRETIVDPLRVGALFECLLLIYTRERALSCFKDWSHSKRAPTLKGVYYGFR